MKAKQLTWAAVTGLLMFTAACTSEEQEAGASVDGMVAFVPSQASTRASDTQFDTGDAIGVFASMDEHGILNASGNYADNVKYVYSSNRFINAGAGIQLAQSAGHSVSYYAVYPFSENVTPEFEFTVNGDQTTYDKFTKSDLCMAYQTAEPTEAIVPLKFNHMLSRVMIDASLAGLIPGNYRIELIAYKSKVKANLQEQVVTPISGGTALRVKMAEDGTNHFKAIIPPQTLRTMDVVASLFIGNDPSRDVQIIRDVELVSGQSVELKLLKNANGVYYLDYGGSGDSSIPDDPTPDDTPDIPDGGDVTIPNVQYVCEIQGNNVICKLDMTGIQHPTTLEWLRLYGTGNPDQNIWISLDGRGKGFTIYNNEDESGESSIKTDVVFVVDNSGSMSEEANAVARDIISWSQSLVSSGLDVRFACVGYSVSGTINGAIDFTTASGLSSYLNRTKGTSRTIGFAGANSTALSQAANAYRVSDECGAMAILYANANFNFRSGANRIYVNFTDEPNQPNYKQGYSVEFFKNQYNWSTNQGTVHSVYSGPMNESWKDYYKEKPWLISEYTGGTTFFTNGSFTGVNLNSLPVTGAMQHSYVIRFRNIAYMVDDGQYHLLRIIIYTPDGIIRGARTYNVKFVLAK